MTRRSSKPARRSARIKAALALCVALFCAPLQAQTLLRDAEIEAALHLYAAPLLALEPSRSVQFHVLWSSDVNAFVTQGGHIFFTSNLLRFSKEVSEVQAVIAHEFGHALGDHYALTVSDYDRASRLAAIIAASSLPLIAISPEAVVAGVIAAPQAIMNLTLAERRARETAADASGANLLERAGLSARGMLTFLERLHSTPVEGYARYLQSHPSTQERVAFLARSVERSPFFSQAASPALQQRHARVRAKIEAYALEPKRVLKIYAAQKSLPAAYARAIAYHRSGESAKALLEIQLLLEKHPQDPYFYEMQANVQRARQNLPAARDSYRKALEFVVQEHSVPIRLLLFDCLLELGEEENLAEARRVLKQALAVEEDSVVVRRRLARLYDRTGEEGQRALVWAEAAWLSGESAQAFCSAQQALALLEKSSAAYLRAQDIARQVSSEQNKNAKFSCS